MRFWMHCAKEYDFDLDTPFEELSEGNPRYADLMEPTAAMVKVHYKGQRGEGVYDVAFEGLIRNVETPLPGDRFRDHEGRNMRALCGSRPVRHVKGQRLKQGVPGSYRRWEKYL